MRVTTDATFEQRTNRENKGMNVRCILSVVGISLLMGCASNQVRITEPLKLSFVIDQQYDANAVVGILRSDDPAGLESRARSMGIDLEVAHKIHDTSDLSEAKRMANSLVADRFKDDGAAIEASKSEFEGLWKKVLPVYSRVVVDTTQAAWIHPEYTCVVSSIHPGLSDWFGNKVAVRFDRSPIFKRRILAHEILLSDVFQLLRQHHSKAEVSDWQVWAFSEVTALLILNDPRLEAFWPSFPHFSNYPQLSPLIDKLRQVFSSRNSYRDYEQKSVPILKDFKPL